MQPWLSNIRLLSFDAYGTLVQLNPVRQPISEAIAAGAPAGTDPEIVFRAVLQRIFAALEALAQEPDRFITARQIFTDAFALVLPRHGVTTPMAEVAELMAVAHRQAPFFPEVGASLERLRQHRPDLQRWLSSDIDDDLLSSSVLDWSGWHGLVTSESAQGYKLQPNGRFFGQLLTRTGAQPAEALHIGDAVSDVIGAARHGLRTCWVNRHGRTWDRPEATPDLEVRDLSELTALFMAAAPADSGPTCP